MTPVISHPTQTVIAAIARQTADVERNGQIESVTIGEGRCTSRGSFFAVKVYCVTFANGTKQNYWLTRGSVVQYNGRLY